MRVPYSPPPSRLRGPPPLAGENSIFVLNADPSLVGTRAAGSGLAGYAIAVFDLRELGLACTRRMDRV